MGLFGKKDKSSNADNRSGQTVTLNNGQSYTISASVDCLGDSCPRPQLMTKKALASSSPNDVVEVLVDNPTSMEALPPLCPGLAATHLETVNYNKGWQVYIQKN